MYKIINHPDIPESLRTPILVDEKIHIPRYWVSIYSLIFFSNLSHATQTRKLRYMDWAKLLEKNYHSHTYYI